MLKNTLVAQDPTYSLLRLAEAITCWRAVGVITGSAATAMLLVTLGGLLASASWLFTAVFGLLALVVMVAGVNGAGICLTDMVHGRPFRNLPSYVLAGLFTLHRLIGANIVIFLAYLGLLLTIALVLFVCKLPGLGPVMLVVAIPLAVLAVSTALIGLYVATFLVIPAIWDGEKVFHALSITWTVTRRHPFAVMVKMIAGLLLAGLFAGLLFAVLFAASFVVGGMAIPILGAGMSLDFGMLMGGGGRRLAGAAAGMGIGYALVYAAAASVVFLLPLMVGVLTWGEYSQKVDLSAIRESADASLKQVNHKVNEMKERGQAVGSSVETAVMPKPQPEPVPAAEIPCPKCGEAVQIGDRFCGSCGNPMV